MDCPFIKCDEFEQARSELGGAFVRILEYYREDGRHSVDAIEAAADLQDVAALISPAHTLKGESRQFGAATLGDITEVIERTARACGPADPWPESLTAPIAGLRACFETTLEAMFAASDPKIVDINAARRPRPTDSRPDDIVLFK